MVTLQQIYNKATADGAVAKTGETACWDASGTTIICAGTGQDGAQQKGRSVYSRFADNGDGTVTDNLTGLIWLKNANCFGAQTWTNALSNSNTLASGDCGLTDGSAAGAWRLPNIRELQSLVDFGQYGSILPAGSPFVGVQPNFYWSSTTSVSSPASAWLANMSNGFQPPVPKTGADFVWPVRGGQ
jgi:hypothetical protein